jgi:hypothetical protein
VVRESKSLAMKPVAGGAQKKQAAFQKVALTDTRLRLVGDAPHRARQSHKRSPPSGSQRGKGKDRAESPMG